MSWLYTSRIAAGRSLTRLGVAMATTASSLRVIMCPCFFSPFLSLLQDDTKCSSGGAFSTAACRGA